MGEYGGVIVALAALTAALVSLASQIGALPVKEKQALALVDQAADGKGIPRGEARAVYRKAPYRKPFLRYVYTLGYTAGDPQTCALEQVFGPTPLEDLVAELRKQPGVVERLRKAKITVVAAARAFQRGFAKRCG